MKSSSKGNIPSGSSSRPISVNKTSSTFIGLGFFAGGQAQHSLMWAWEVWEVGFVEGGFVELGFELPGCWQFKNELHE